MGHREGYYKAYADVEKRRAYMKAWRLSDAGKSYIKKWAASPTGKLYRKVYEAKRRKTYTQTKAYKLYMKMFRQTEKYKNTEKAYRLTEGYKNMHRLARMKRDRHCEILERVDKQFLMFSHQNKCAYCGCDLVNDKTTHIDHLIPVSRYIKIGKKFPYRYSTVAPTCAPCNLKKQDKTPLEFMWASNSSPESDLG
jgi:5-methylcytosine-specific restriction endonuclease McrA